MRNTQEILSTQTISELTQTRTLQETMKAAAQRQLASVLANIAEVEARIASGYADQNRDKLVTICKSREVIVEGRSACKFHKAATLRAALVEADQEEKDEWNAEAARWLANINDYNACLVELNTAIVNIETAMFLDELAAEVEAAPIASPEPAGRQVVKNLKSRVLPIGYETEIGLDGQITAYFKNESLGTFDSVLKAHRAIGKHAPRVEMPAEYQVEKINGKDYGMSYIYKKDEAGAWRPIDNKGAFVAEVYGTDHCYRVRYKQAERLVLKLAGVLDQYMSR